MGTVHVPFNSFERPIQLEPRNRRKTKMPAGMVVIGWNDRVGTIMKAKYPEDIELSPDLAMKIYGSHVLGEAREAGFISMKVGELNIASYFGGIEVNHFVSVILTSEEEAPEFESALTRVAAEIFTKLEKDKFKKELPSLYRHLATFPTFTEEQRLAFIYADPKTRAALGYLNEVGSTSKEELVDVLRDRLDLKTISVEAVIQPLVRAGLGVVEWVEGVPSECVFLIEDAMPVVVPPADLVKRAQVGTLPESKKYLKAVRTLFTSEKAILDENQQISIAEMLVDPDAYEVVKILRDDVLDAKTVASKADVSEEVMGDILKKLRRVKLVLQDKKAGLFLLADPTVVTAYPEHLITTSITRYNKRDVLPRQAARHLSLLRDHFKEQLVTAES
jgi:hypothetical protein